MDVRGENTAVKSQPIGKLHAAAEVTSVCRPYLVSDCIEAHIGNDLKTYKYSVYLIHPRRYAEISERASR